MICSFLTTWDEYDNDSRESESHLNSKYGFEVTSDIYRSGESDPEFQIYFLQEMDTSKNVQLENLTVLPEKVKAVRLHRERIKAGRNYYRSRYGRNKFEKKHRNRIIRHTSYDVGREVIAKTKVWMD
jgi:hypothetical protein